MHTPQRIGPIAIAVLPATLQLPQMRSDERRKRRPRGHSFSYQGPALQRTKDTKNKNAARADRSVLPLEFPKGAFLSRTHLESCDAHIELAGLEPIVLLLLPLLLRATEECGAAAHRSG